MPGKRVAVFGMYHSAVEAEEGLDRLTSERFASNDISVVMRDAPGARSASGTLGLLAGLSAWSVPQSQPLLAAGPIRAQLNHLPVNLPEHRDLATSLAGLGIRPDEARRFAATIEGGGVLLSIQCKSSSEVARALEVLKAGGAEGAVTDLHAKTKPEARA